MLKKLSDILKYYDSEPLEIMIGMVWLIFFPIIWSCQFGIQAVLVIISILLGGSLIKSVCGESLRSRKTLAYGSFLFSIVILVLLILNGGLFISANWIWFLPLMMSIVTLIQITAQFYRKQK